MSRLAAKVVGLLGRADGSQSDTDEARAQELGKLVFGQATLDSREGTLVDKGDPAQPACGELFRQRADYA